MEKVDARLVSHAGFLHGFPQIGRADESLRGGEVIDGEQHDNFVGIVDPAEQMQFLELGALAHGLVSVVDGFPFGVVGDFVADEQVAHDLELSFIVVVEGKSHFCALFATGNRWSSASV